MSMTSVSVDLLTTNSADTTMKTALCHMLGIEYPIVAAPMGPDLTGPEMVAAVSNAGGLGILQAQFCAAPLFREEIHRVRALTDKPFGVNLLLHLRVEDHVAVCLEERVPVLSLFWGDPTPYVEPAHAAGVKVFHQVGSVPDAQRAAAAGVDVIIAQGVEAGGHVAGEVSTLALVPRIVDAVSSRPVAAAGGIADGRGLVAILALGAQAAVLGTRFLASSESRAHPHYKQMADGGGGERGGHRSDYPFWSRLAERPAQNLADGIRAAMARPGGAWSRIPPGRAGGRPDGDRRPAHARPAVHGIPTEC